MIIQNIQKRLKKLIDFFLSLFFPKICFGCKKEGTFLCEDCLSTILIFKEHQKFKGKFLDDLFVATEYKNPLVKRLILAFKYEPLVKELKKDLAKLIKIHFELLNQKPDFSDFVVVSVPLHPKRLRWRGFNQSLEIAKEISAYFQIPLIENCLVKEKNTPPQVTLSEKERKKIVKGVFKVVKKEEIKRKKILLVDDVFTTGSTMEEIAKILKEAGAEKVMGLAVAIAKPEEDKFS